ncbi:hypothetical protein [Methylobacterium sp. Gmos1]
MLLRVGLVLLVPADLSRPSLHVAASGIGMARRGLHMGLKGLSEVIVAGTITSGL